jgi:NAD dependent epimerase/dehydratase family enzyme
MRTSMVLGQGINSVFPVLKRLTCLGLGGRQGSGRQYVSWIHAADFCHAVEWILAHDSLAGPVNICAPNPVTNAEMMKLFRRECGMPFGLPAALWMLELGAFIMRTETELVLKSRRVIPQKLLKSGFTFAFPILAGALRNLNSENKVASARI